MLLVGRTEHREFRQREHRVAVGHNQREGEAPAEPVTKRMSRKVAKEELTDPIA